jgi:4-amino-4-deoxy-L-arabinose transferase-like glycosyltransferase
LLLGGGLPWVGASPFALRAAHGDDAGFDRCREGVHLAACWLVGGFAFLSAAGSKLVTYLLPLFPAVALLSTVAWASWLERRNAARWPRAVHAIQCTAMAVVVCGASAVAARRFVIGDGGAIWLSTATVALLWLAGALTWRLKGPAVALGASLALVALTLLTTVGVLLPRAAPRLTARPLAEWLNQRGRLPAQIWVVDERIGSLVFYLAPRLRDGLSTERLRSVGFESVLTMRQAPRDTLIAIPMDAAVRLDRFVDLRSARPVEVGHYRVYMAEAFRDALVTGP